LSRHRENALKSFKKSKRSSTGPGAPERPIRLPEEALGAVRAALISRLDATRLP